MFGDAESCGWRGDGMESWRWMADLMWIAELWVDGLILIRECGSRVSGCAVVTSRMRVCGDPL